MRVALHGLFWAVSSLADDSRGFGRAAALVRVRVWNASGLSLIREVTCSRFPKLMAREISAAFSGNSLYLGRVGIASRVRNS